MIRFLKLFSSICIFSLLVNGCVSQNNTTRNRSISPTSIAATSQTSQPAVTETAINAEPTKPVDAINPLTGLLVQDPSLLDLPAVLVSIAHFPPAARPQSGLSFAPFVFEIYITEGATRFLTTFYGEFPAPENNITGNCAVRTEPFVQTDFVLGNRVWLDANRNQMQDAWERGIGCGCVNLYNSNNNLLQQTTTDSNGYYAFNVKPGKYLNKVLKPQGMAFDQKKVGADEQDSDVDQATGWSDALDVSSTLLNLDAGLPLL